VCGNPRAIGESCNDLNPCDTGGSCSPVTEECEGPPAYIAA
jgi:hypothetical protein